MDNNCNTATIKVLDEVYRNVKNGSDTILDILPTTEDKFLKSEMTSQLDKFEKYIKDTSELLMKNGSHPKKKNPVSRFEAKASLKINSLFDNSTSHTAEIIKEGLISGVDSLTSVSEKYRSECSEEALKIANEVIAFECSEIEAMNSYIN